MTWRVEYWVQCDEKDCGECVWTDSGGSKEQAIEHAKEMGWVVKRVAGKDIAVCPRCKEAIESNEPRTKVEESDKGTN